MVSVPQTLEIESVVSQMSEERLHLENTPIIEAIVDIDCELPLDFELEASESAIRAALEDAYPNMQPQIVQEFQVSQLPGPQSEGRIRQELSALRFQKADGKQLVQFRTGGFSFNRLALYEGLDNYLLEIRRTWELFLELVEPVQMHKLGIRWQNIGF